MLIERSPIASREAAGMNEATPALIGPHALIHAVAAMRERLGDRETAAILANAQISAVPTGEVMVPEIEALRLHRWLALREPVDCFVIAEEAARRTADYVIANRMPALAVRLLRVLPAKVSGPLLMAAIRRHAWTFIGAGRFTSADAWTFEIDRGPADDPVLPPESLFHWYAMVFERMYRRLVSDRCRCEPDAPSAREQCCRTYRLRFR